MFGALKSLGNAVANLAVAPVAIVADAATSCGILTDRREPYTVTSLKGAAKHIGDAVDDLSK